jgi:hypothetical protein
MADEHARIEFLEPHEEPDAIAWLDADDEEDLGSRGSSLLPPRTTARRVLLTLLVFGLALATTGFAGMAAFRHDQAVQVAADSLVLRGLDVGDPVTLTDPGELGTPDGWKVDPSAAIAVDVTNEGPDSITLLPGATLYGPGLRTPAALKPSGTTLLRPGQNGTLTGVATVDCGVPTERLSFPGQNSTVLVQARTAGGAVGMATVPLGGGGSESVRQQICVDEGEGLVANFQPGSVDSTKHTFTLTVSAHSRAAQALEYRIIESYSSSSPSFQLPTPVETAAPAAETVVFGTTASSILPGVELSAPTPVGAVSGTLAAGASVSAGFTVHVLSCPKTPPTAQASVDLEVLLEDDGTPATLQTQGSDLDALVGAACGLHG